LEANYNTGRTYPEKTGRRTTIIVLDERDVRAFMPLIYILVFGEYKVRED
jgi:hypothetical protein